MSEEQPVRPLSVEILPRERSDVALPPNTPAGIPLLARAKYWATRKALESYVRAIQVQAEAFRALEARERAREAYERTLVRAERLDDIRRMEEIRVDKELAELTEDAELRAIRMRAAKAVLEAEAILAERRLAEIKTPAAPETKPGMSSGEQAVADITQIRKDAEALRKALIETYGGEDKLTEEDRALLIQLEVAIRNKVAERLERL